MQAPTRLFQALPVDGVRHILVGARQLPGVESQGSFPPVLESGVVRVAWGAEDCTPHRRHCVEIAEGDRYLRSQFGIGGFWPHLCMYSVLSTSPARLRGTECRVRAYLVGQGKRGIGRALGSCESGPSYTFCSCDTASPGFPVGVSNIRCFRGVKV